MSDVGCGAKWSFVYWLPLPIAWSWWVSSCVWGACHTDSGIHNPLLLAWLSCGYDRWTKAPTHEWLSARWVSAVLSIPCPEPSRILLRDRDSTISGSLAHSHADRKRKVLLWWRDFYVPPILRGQCRLLAYLPLLLWVLRASAHLAGATPATLLDHRRDSHLIVENGKMIVFH